MENPPKPVENILLPCGKPGESVGKIFPKDKNFKVCLGIFSMNLFEMSDHSF
ncbi:hypothetical protein PL8927_760162 [Planktothrix serta PCC 8927]|uniref:Uncharacterized protein n=1 Tax=Planktothrix serta PCC 8927 TaxID=671068 RepID=A0A7Z9BWX7_9CYAN|nr:hypothetical protein PL8927_760162 [Planktothrix serta PCC 8927]